MIPRFIHRSSAMVPFCILALLALGCQSTNTYQPASGVSDEHLSRIITDSGANRRAMVQSVTTGDVGGLLRVQVNIENRNAGFFKLRPDQHGFRYKFEWFADQGMKVYDPNESWKRKTVEAREFTTITATAPTPGAVDWRLSIHRWKDH